MRAGKFWPIASLAVGIALCCLGAVFIWSYVAEAVIARAGASDQSLLFWYLPVLFSGIFICAAGLSVGVWGFTRLRKMKMQNRQ